MSDFKLVPSCVWRLSGVKAVPSCVWLTSPPGQRRTVARGRRGSSVGTPPWPILASPPCPFWKSFKKDVGSLCFVRTSHPARRQAESGCLQGGHGEAFASPPSGQAGRWPWFSWPEGNNPYFLALATERRRQPPFGVGLFIDTRCAKI